MLYERGKLESSFWTCLESGSSCLRLPRSSNCFLKFCFKDFMPKKSAYVDMRFFGFLGLFLGFFSSKSLSPALEKIDF